MTYEELKQDAAKFFGHGNGRDAVDAIERFGFAIAEKAVEDFLSKKFPGLGVIASPLLDAGASAVEAATDSWLDKLGNVTTSQTPSAIQLTPEQADFVAKLDTAGKRAYYAAHAS